MTNTLNSGGTLATGASLTSTNGLYTLLMQADGDLVLRQVKGEVVLWSSDTSGRGVTCTMEIDGDLVVGNGTELWDSETSGVGNYLVVQNDGNLVIYNSVGREIWATDTEPVARAVLDLNNAKAALAVIQQGLVSVQASIRTSTGGRRTRTPGPGANGAVVSPGPSE
jgi:hypothetical protein